MCQSSCFSASRFLNCLWSCFSEIPVFPLAYFRSRIYSRLCIPASGPWNSSHSPHKRLTLCLDDNMLKLIRPDWCICMLLVWLPPHRLILFALPPPARLVCTQMGTPSSLRSVCSWMLECLRITFTECVIWLYLCDICILSAVELYVVWNLAELLEMYHKGPVKFILLFYFPQIPFPPFEFIRIPFLPFRLILPLESMCCTVFSLFSHMSFTYLHASTRHNVDRFALQSHLTHKFLSLLTFFFLFLFFFESWLCQLVRRPIQHAWIVWGWVGMFAKWHMGGLRY